MSERQFVVVVCTPPRHHAVVGPFRDLDAARNYVRGLRTKKDYDRFKQRGGKISARPFYSPYEEWQ